MNQWGKHWIYALLIIFTVSACSAQPTGDVSPTVDIQTQIAIGIKQTITAYTLTPTETQTPSITPSPTSTHTPTPPHILARVSANTICREGADKGYKSLGELHPGEESLVVARLADGNYYYIENPDQPGSYCWLWGGAATLSADATILPIITSLPTLTPTPGPDFTMKYMKLQQCGDFFVLEFSITNTGVHYLRSAHLSVTDTKTGEIIQTKTNFFFDFVDCHNFASYVSYIYPGESITHLRSNFKNNPIGHYMKAELTMCTEMDLKGICIKKNLYFTP